jgi:hypothetical protein
MDSGEPLLGAVVATPRRALLERVCGADRLWTPLWAVEPAIERDLARGLRWKRIVATGQRMVDQHLRLNEEALNWEPAEVTVPSVPAIPASRR